MKTSTGRNLSLRGVGFSTNKLRIEQYKLNAYIKEKHQKVESSKEIKQLKMMASFLPLFLKISCFNASEKLM